MKRLGEEFPLDPSNATEASAGLDLRACIKEQLLYDSYNCLSNLEFIARLIFTSSPFLQAINCFRNM